jgi:hypothetical protein
MAWTTRFDPTARRGVLVADGPIDLAGSVEAMLSLAADPRLETGWGILVDLSGATYTPTLADAMKLGGLQSHAEALEGHRVAFLTASPALHAVAGLLASMATAKGIEARAFDNVEAADGWLR